jgi:carbon starvation protein
VIPLVWLLAVTFTAGAEKVWSADPRLGFNVAADAAGQKREQLRSTLASVPPEELPARQKEIASLTKQIFNLRLDAVVAIAFLGLVSVIVLISLREWVLLLLRRRAADLHEADPVWLPDCALKESGPNLRTAAGAAAIALGLAKELSGESQFERARQNVCACEQHSDRKVFAQVTEERFNGVRRCC